MSLDNQDTCQDVVRNFCVGETLLTNNGCIKWAKANPEAAATATRKHCIGNMTDDKCREAALAAKSLEYDAGATTYCTTHQGDPYCACFRKPCYTKECASDSAYKTLEMLNAGCNAGCEDILQLDFNKLDLKNPRVMKCITENVGILVAKIKTYENKDKEIVDLQAVRGMLNSQIKRLKSSTAKSDLQYLVTSVNSAIDYAKSKLRITHTKESFIGSFGDSDNVLLIVLVIIAAVVFAGLIIAGVCFIKSTRGLQVRPFDIRSLPITPISSGGFNSSFYERDNDED
jgi:hypothetical protein